jgi:hypothetical protein
MVRTSEAKRSAGFLAGWTGGVSPPSVVLAQGVVGRESARFLPSVDFDGHESLGARCLIL